MAKHGIANFECCVFYNDAPKEFTLEGLKQSEADLLILEVITIAERGTQLPNGYNITVGGEGTSGWKMSDEGKRHLSEIRLGVKLSEETCQNISKGRLGYKHSEEAKLKMSKVQSGRVVSLEGRKNMSIARTGVKLSPEHALKIKEKAVARAYKQFKGILIWEFNMLVPLYFASATLAATYLKTAPSNLSGWLQGKHTINLPFAIAYAD